MDAPEGAGFGRRLSFLGLVFAKLDRMMRRWATLALMAVVPSEARAANVEPFLLPDPGDGSKSIEYFAAKPAGRGPWPTVVFLHGHQEDARPGAKDFAEWGVLSEFASRGYLAAAVSQPGYGRSSGPADFCGPRTRRAVSTVIRRLVAEGAAARGKIAIQGVSRGAIVAGLVAADNAEEVAGVVMISGVFDLARFTADAKGSVSKQLIARAIVEETGGGAEALRERSVHARADRIKARVLILNGADDELAGPDQARRFSTEVNARGGRALAIVFPGIGHNIPPPARDRIVNEFIDDALKGRTPGVR